ncbi:DUF4230 domain-containing protein [Herbidospora sp. RD11066]
MSSVQRTSRPIFTTVAVVAGTVAIILVAYFVGRSSPSNDNPNSLLLASAAPTPTPSPTPSPTPTPTVEADNILSEAKSAKIFIGHTKEYTVVPFTYKEPEKTILGVTVPDIISGRSVDLVGVGTVEAVIDLSRLTDYSIAVSADDSIVHVTLPKPYLLPVRLDHKKIKVLDTGRGIADWFRDILPSEVAAVLADKVYEDLSKRIDAEAAADAELFAKAKVSIENFITLIAMKFGAEQDKIEFEYA